MKFQLKKDLIVSKIKSKGISQKDLATELGVSPQAVSSWLKGKKMPESKNLIKISKILDISFNEIIQKKIDYTYNFKLPDGVKIPSAEKIEKSEDMASCLEELLPYVRKIFFKKPTRLINPDYDLDYIETVTNEYRKEVISNNNIDSLTKIPKELILSYMKNQLNTVIIPVLWGNKKHFANALNFSFTDLSFLYINLNSEIDDLRFWLLHEFGHLINPDNSEKSEKFADQFAAYFLVDTNLAQKTYQILNSGLTHQEKINFLNSTASHLGIAPYTIYKRAVYYSRQHNIDFKFDYEYIPHTSKSYFVYDENFTIKKYIDYDRNVFNSNFFSYLSNYLKDNDNSSSHFIMRLLNISYYDAIEIFNFIIKWKKE